MSHFTCLVAADDEQQLHERLLPYHEYECTGINEYIEFQPADMEELEEEWKRHKGDLSDSGKYLYFDLNEFAIDYFGYKKNDEGVYGRWTNPNKWRWIDANNEEIAITVGRPSMPFVRENPECKGEFLLDDEGRLVHLLQRLHERETQHGTDRETEKGLVSEGDLRNQPSEIRGNVGESGREVPDMQGQLEVESGGLRDRSQPQNGNSESDSLHQLQYSVRPSKGRYGHIGQAQSIPSPIQREFISGARWDWWTIGGRWTGLLQLKPEAVGNGYSGQPGLLTQPNRDPQYADSALASEIDWEVSQTDNPPLTFSFIDTEGKWHQRAKMGWWAVTTDSDSAYAKEFDEFIAGLGPSQRVYLIDCHI